jgi:hypothetical protein
MNIEKILKHSLINRAELARLMFPNKKGRADSLLDRKMNGMQRNRITDKDREKIEKIMNELYEEIKD